MSDELEEKSHIVEVMVPMRNGIELQTEVFLPEGEGPFPALLARCTYGTQGVRGQAARFTEHGYAVLAQNVRVAGSEDSGSMTAPKTYRWYQFRLWLMVIVIPLGGLVLGLPWAELQQHNRDAAFRRELEEWSPASDIKKDHQIIAKIAARRLPMIDLPHVLLQICLIRPDRLYLRGFVYHLTPDRRIIGAIDLRDNWQIGSAPEIDQEVLRAIAFMQGVDRNLSASDAIQLLDEKGIGKGHNSALSYYSRSLTPDYSLTLGMTWSSKSREASGAPTDSWYWSIHSGGSRWRRLYPVYSSAFNFLERNGP